MKNATHGSTKQVSPVMEGHLTPILSSIAQRFSCKNADNRPIFCDECPLGRKVDNFAMSTCIVIDVLLTDDAISAKEWEVNT